LQMKAVRYEPSRGEREREIEEDLLESRIMTRKHKQGKEGRGQNAQAYSKLGGPKRRCRSGFQKSEVGAS